MKKNLFTLCMMLLLSMLSFAQGSLTISGVVTEKKTGEPIIGCQYPAERSIRPEPLRTLTATILFRMFLRAPLLFSVISA